MFPVNFGLIWVKIGDKDFAFTENTADDFMRIDGEVSLTSSPAANLLSGSNGGKNDSFFVAQKP